jgi:integrase
MSVYKPKGSPYYQYDFEFRGHRFHGSTKCTSRREAEAVERVEKANAKRRMAERQNATVRLDLDAVIDRYWLEVGQHHAGSSDTWRDLSRLIDYFGADKLITEITDDDVARLVAWRRGHRIVRNKESKPEDCPLITAATVNRSTTGVLKKLFTRAKSAWSIRFDHEPHWRAHMLPESPERVRELVGDEGDKLEAATRDDYLPFFDFVRVSGMRQRECLLRWPEVNWDTRQIIKRGKRGRLITVPMTDAICDILKPLQGHHSEMVFTYIAKRTRGGQVKGKRYPITRAGLKSTWKRLCKKAGVVRFRFHDFRHDFATKLLRRTGNLKLVQRALNHADLKTTTRYAHVLDAEVAEAMEAMAKSRKKSRTPPTKTG